MSFVGDPFSVDIFISYSHGNVDGSGRSLLKRWSSAFWRTLDEELRMHLDLAGLKIFFDDSPRPGMGVDPFSALTPELEDKASRAAVFMPLISPHYLNSAWCLKELEWWRSAQPRLGHDADGRLAPVLIWGMPPPGSATWPEALAPLGMSDLAGVKFFAPEDVVARPQPFGWPGVGDLTEDERFHAQFYDNLVRRLKLRLFDFRDMVQAVDRQPLVATGVKPSIYLHGRGDDAESWERAADALTDAGFPVMPDSPEPVEPDAVRRNGLREDAVEAMSNCHALLAVGPRDSLTLGSEIAVLNSNRGAARDLALREGRAGKRLPCGVLDNVGDPARARRRRAWAQNNQLGWFDMEDPAWVGQADAWLGAAIA